jgi:hypothetical protein
MRGVQPFSMAELEAMPTKRLLGHLERLRRCEEDIGRSDVEPSDPELRSADLIHFKDDPRWDEQYRELKRILARREHVPGASERKARRIQKVKEARDKPRARPRRDLR